MIVLIDILICVGKGQKLLIITVYQATPQVCVQNGKPVPTQIGYGLILGLYCYAYVFLVKSEQLISNNKISRFLMYNLRISHNKGSFVQKIQQKRKKRNKTPSAFPLRLLLFVPCRGFFDLPALFVLRLFERGFLSILYLSMRFLLYFNYGARRVYLSRGRKRFLT